MATTTGTGAKKINGTDNWREIFDDHNDTVDAYDGIIGTTSLPTTAQTLTGAVAEQNGAIGNLANLTTTEKGSLVGAANELNSKIGNFRFVDGGANPSNWDNAYGTENDTISLHVIMTSSMPSGSPSGAYGYGNLISILHDKSAGMGLANSQIYIPDGPQFQGIFFRSGTGNWVKVTGTEIAKNA